MAAQIPHHGTGPMRKIDLPITAPRAMRGGARMVLVGESVLRAC